MKYVEFHVRKLSEELVELLKKFKYHIIVCDDVKKYDILNDVTIIPRVTSSNANELKTAPRNAIRAYMVKSKEDLKNYPKLKRVANIVTLTDEALIRLGPKSIEKIVNLGLPVEICVNDIIRVLEKSRYLKGLYNLMRYAASNSIDLIVSSCPTKNLDVLHPILVRSILEELGLSSIQAKKALTQTPIKVLRGIGYNVYLE